MWNYYCSPVTLNSEKSETPGFVKPPLQNFNFVYTALPVKKYTSVLDFTMLTDTFDIWIWLRLSLALILVAIIAFSSFENKKKKFETAFMASLACCLLSSGDSELQHRSGLFTLWMLTCAIVDTLYSGNLTIEVISPTPEDTIENIDQLEQHNYRLIFGRTVWYGIIKSTADDVAAAQMYS